VRVSYPKDLFDLISNSFGLSKAIDYCKVMNERAPLTVRANILKTSRDNLFSIFKKKGFDVRKTEFSPYGISFNTNPHTNFFSMDEFKQGYFEVQDEGSQLVALRVDCKVSKDLVLIFSQEILSLTTAEAALANPLPSRHLLMARARFSYMILERTF
jgi:16S rRNA C967 or C1407 C5-methylase (RsmB/RsmF family)